jgi:hypothetical protein
LEENFGSVAEGMKAVQSVQAALSSGGAKGWQEAVKEYEAHGGKGGLLGLTNLIGKVESTGRAADAIGKLNASQIANESFFDYATQASSGQSLKQWAGAEAFLKQAKILGVNPIIAGEVNNMLATTEKGITMGSPAEAEKIGQMQAYMLKGELDGLGGNPSKAEFLAATEMTKRLAYAYGIGGPAGAAVVGRGQGQFDAAYWEEIGKKAAILGKYQADGLLTSYNVDKIISDSRGDTKMMDSMIYTQINQKMNSLLPTLKNALLGNGTLTQKDSKFMMAVLHSDPKDPMMASLKSQLLQDVANIESSIHTRGTSSAAGAGLQLSNTTSEEVSVGAGVKGVGPSVNVSNKTSLTAETDVRTQSTTSHNDFVPKYLQQLNNLNYDKIKDANQFVRTANEIAEKTVGNPIGNAFPSQKGRDWEHNSKFKNLPSSFTKT